MMIVNDDISSMKQTFNINDYLENGRLLMYWFDGYED